MVRRTKNVGGDTAGPGSGSVAGAAQALLQRVRWEVENGRCGFPRRAVVTPVAANVAVADPGDPLGPAGLDELRAEIGECTRCRLHEGRTKLVFGEGSATARLVFLGEGPGQEEDRTGRPFVGAAGQLLDRIIEAIGLSREAVYICNIVKCRPPRNRDPQPDEAEICGRFARCQLKIISPEVVVTLGRPATQYLLGVDEPIGRLRGRFHRVGDLNVMPTYHPAYLLRNPEAKRPVWEDMKQVRDRLGLSGSGGR